MQLIVEDVSKTIRKNEILSHVNLSLESGKIYGFVGMNGSGKTMLFRALSGLMRTTSGTIRLDDQVLHRDMKVLPGLGITLENAGLYPELSGFENLKLLAKIRGKVSDEDIRRTIQKVGLNPRDRRSFRRYSLGMKQRIVLAQALMEQPDILMLDEPTNGLDVDGVQEIRRILLEEKQRGAMILIASHNSEDIRLLADEVYEIRAGKVRRRGDEEKEAVL